MEVQSFTLKIKLTSNWYRIYTYLSSKIENMKLLPKLLWKNEFKESYQSSLEEQINILTSTNKTISLRQFTESIEIAGPNQRNGKQFYLPKNKWFDTE